MDQATLRKKFLSLRGHLIMLGVPIAALLLLTDLIEAYQGRWLTWSFVFRMAMIRLLAGTLIAVLGWYAVTRPYLNRSRQ